MHENECLGRTFLEDLSNQDSREHNLSFPGGKNADKTNGKMKINHQEGTVLPLPGILDHMSFRRSPVTLGSCDVCGKGGAVYHSDEQRSSVCEGCYARLVREWNRAKGVG
ncbi:MAG: hypothetical protein GX097_04860 [Methanomicrobiales archaeon]|nr:hypothetical protein [Methanomicrobiales archaeon]